MSVRHAMLALLSEGPKYGLQLRQEFEAGTGEVWPLNVGQVYTTLQRLERDGLVESDDAEEEGPQKGFRITAAGRTELDALAADPARHRPRRRATSWSSRCSSRCGCPASTSPTLVQTHRRQLVEMMQRYTRLKEDATDDDLALVLVVDAEIYRLDALIRWLDARGRDASSGKPRRRGHACRSARPPPVPESEVVR